MENLTVDQIVKATGAPPKNVGVSWPLVLAALSEFGIDSPLVQVAAAATIAVETSIFMPLTEKRADSNRQPALWAIQARYWPSGFFGRGFIQLTWKSEYDRMGKALGIDLVSNPALAATPKIAARILALYFKENHVSDAANEGKWQLSRKIVNHGMVGWDKYIDVVHKLTE